MLGLPPSMLMAPVGHASAHSRQPSGHLAASITGRPRKRSGSVGSWAGYAMVRCPCFKRARATCSIGHSQIMSAVGQVEALVAEREVGNRLVAQGDRQAEPVMEGRIDDLVALEAAGGVGKGDVADCAAPALDERHRQMIGANGGGGALDRAVGKRL